MMSLSLKSQSLVQTNQLARVLAKNLVGGEVIEFISDLGGGKTAFVRGVVAVLDSDDQASSPSFTIENIYRCPKFNIHHFDFYRLTTPGLMAAELAEVQTDKQAVVMIEWPEIVADVLPKQRLTIKINHTDPETRCFSFAAPESLAYLLAGLKACAS